MKPPPRSRWVTVLNVPIPDRGFYHRWIYWDSDWRFLSHTGLLEGVCFLEDPEEVTS